MTYRPPIKAIHELLAREPAGSTPQRTSGRRKPLSTPLEFAAIKDVGGEERAMNTWAPSKRARNERINAEADALIRDLGDRAYQEARRREHEASSDEIAEDWALVAKAIARKTGSRVGLNLSSQLAMNTFFVLDREPGVAQKARPRPGPDEEPESQVKSPGVPTPQPFRIQFMGAGTAAGPSVLREDQIRASDVSAAIIAAAIAAWPPHTVALRILGR
jgi:hypothetical protein